MNEGGTTRDKAARFRTLRREKGAQLGGVPVFAALAALGWTRAHEAMGPVVAVCDGRVFSLGGRDDLAREPGAIIHAASDDAHRRRRVDAVLDGGDGQVDGGESSILIACATREPRAKSTAAGAEMTTCPTAGGSPESPRVSCSARSLAFGLRGRRLQDG
jgi:hypothetical protein